MKTISVFVALFLSSLAFSQDAQTGTIKIQIPNVSGNEGKVIFGIYSEDTFMKREPDFSSAAEIKDGTAQAVFNEVPQGDYAIIVIHDKNNNQKMDFDSSGMPTENYGTSGEMNLYGPPIWETSKFTFDGSEKNIEIRF
tara:strand:+ start:256 stop:672 length:417 start_codon:yes stop_codon:yes gene_type:complete